ncbi:MAG: DUF2090 domain-containing protein [Myxococcales bacterium]|nr:DUF2090 domain-containing protein [Myxococcales bacterium]
MSSKAHRASSRPKASPRRRPAATELPAYLLAADHRVQLVEQARKLRKDETACREFKYLLVEAFLSAREKSLSVRQKGGLILDPELGPEAIRLARSEGVPFGLPAERSGSFPLELYSNFEELARYVRPAFIKCLLRARQDDPPGLFLAQSATVARLSAACQRARLPLVLELILHRRQAEPEATFDRAVRAPLTAWTMRLLCALGARPAVWKLEGMESAEAIAEVASACSPGVRMVVLGKSAQPETLSKWFRAARTASVCTGFAVGRSIFWEPFLGHLRGAPAEETTAAIRDRYLDVVRRWEAAAP